MLRISSSVKVGLCLLSKLYSFSRIWRDQKEWRAQLPLPQAHGKRKGKVLNVDSQSKHLWYHALGQSSPRWSDVGVHHHLDMYVVTTLNLWQESCSSCGPIAHRSARRQCNCTGASCSSKGHASTFTLRGNWVRNLCIPMNMSTTKTVGLVLCLQNNCTCSLCSSVQNMRAREGGCGSYLDSSFEGDFTEQGDFL